MFDILYIEIKINNNYYKIKDIEKIKNILRIIRTWKTSYYSNKILDGEEYMINIVTKDSNTFYQGKGVFPKNYLKLKQIVGDINV